MSSTTADSYVAKIKLNGKTFPISPTLKGTCDTDASTATKTVMLKDFDIPIDGSDVTVKFTYSNTVANPMLKINNTDPYPIYTYGTTAPGDTPDTSWYAGSVITFMFDGTLNAWIMKDWSSAGSSEDKNDKVRQTPVTYDAEVGDISYPLLTGYTTDSLEEANYAHKTNYIRGGVNEYGTYLEVLTDYDPSSYQESLRITGNDITSSGYIGGGFSSLSQIANTVGYLTSISTADENNLLNLDFTEDEDYHLVSTTMKIEGDITPMTGYWDSQDKYRSLTDMANALASLSGLSDLDDIITVDTTNHTVETASGYAIVIGDVSIYPDTGDIYPTSGTWGDSSYDSLIGMAQDLSNIVGVENLAYEMDNDRILVSRGDGDIEASGTITASNFVTSDISMTTNDIMKSGYWINEIDSLQDVINDLYSKIAALESRLSS